MVGSHPLGATWQTVNKAAFPSRWLGRPAICVALTFANLLGSRKAYLNFINIIIILLDLFTKFNQTHRETHKGELN